MKVKFLIDSDDDNGTTWRDLYIDDSLIDGFYMPDEDDSLDPCVNILYRGNFLTFLQTKPLLAFLELKFI